MAYIASNSLYDALAADIRAAWSPVSITFGLPQVEQPAYPYATVKLSQVGINSVGPRISEQTYKFECMYVDQWQSGSSWNVEQAKADKANALIARLLANPVYASAGLMPSVLSVDFDESDDALKPRYYVTVVFAVTMHVDALEG